MSRQNFIETLFPHAEKERQEREAAEREKPRLDPEVEERKLLAVLAEFEPVQPPPEISPTEAPAEVVKRLEALERQQPFSGTPTAAPTRRPGTAPQSGPRCPAKSPNRKSRRGAGRAQPRARTALRQADRKARRRDRRGRVKA